MNDKNKEQGISNMAKMLEKYEWRDAAIPTVERYVEMKKHAPESMDQYRDMASGGTGGDLDFVPEPADNWLDYQVDPVQPGDIKPTNRSYYYAQVPDEFFALVLQRLGEDC